MSNQLDITSINIVFGWKLKPTEFRSSTYANNAVCGVQHEGNTKGRWCPLSCNWNSDSVTPRRDHGSCAVGNDQIALVGGFDGKTEMADVHLCKVACSLQKGVKPASCTSHFSHLVTNDRALSSCWRLWTFVVFCCLKAQHKNQYPMRQAQDNKTQTVVLSTISLEVLCRILGFPWQTNAATGHQCIRQLLTSTIIWSVIFISSASSVRLHLRQLHNILMWGQCLSVAAVEYLVHSRSSYPRALGHLKDGWKARESWASRCNNVDCHKLFNAAAVGTG